MAARILIEVGAVSGSRAFANQTKAADTLLAFYTKQALGPADATPAQKLDAVAAHLARYIVSQTREMHVFEGRANLATEAGDLYGVD